MSVQAASGTSGTLLHVRLLNEGTDVYRPVWAEPLGNGVYELMTPPDYDPADEEWEFMPGSQVSVAVRRDEAGEVKIAAPPVPRPVETETELVLERAGWRD